MKIHFGKNQESVYKYAVLSFSVLSIWIWIIN